MLPDLGLHMGAGDGNRTRTISLGMSAGTVLAWALTAQQAFLADPE
jgi:hypothetical protein